MPFPPPTWPHCLNPWHRRSPAPHMVSPFTLGSPRSTSAGPRASLYPAQLCPAPAPGRATRSSAPSPARPRLRVGEAARTERATANPEPGRSQSQSQTGGPEAKVRFKSVSPDPREWGLQGRGRRGKEHRSVGGPPPQNGNRESESRVPPILPRG